MQASEFCYWLQGYFEIGGANELTPTQVEVVKNHLALVFVHDLDPKQAADKLQKIHDGKSELPAPSPGGPHFRC